jgi:hypothetical protein
MNAYQVQRTLKRWSRSDSRECTLSVVDCSGGALPARLIGPSDARVTCVTVAGQRGNLEIRTPIGGTKHVLGEA